MALIFNTNKRKKGALTEYTDTGGGGSYLGVNKAVTRPKAAAYTPVKALPSKPKTVVATPAPKTTSGGTTSAGVVPANALPANALPAGAVAEPKMTEYYTNYSPSKDVVAAGAAIEATPAPAPYASRYDGQIQELIGKLRNREPFSYDFNADPLYSQYRDKFTREGELAMMDTMGSAAGLTGGYGSSYATTAGSQAYQSYLGRLNDVLPSLVGSAYQRYADAGAELYERLGALNDLDNADYSRYRDKVGDYQANRSYAATLYEMLYSQDYERYADSVKQSNTDREYAYRAAQDAQKAAAKTTGGSASSSSKKAAEKDGGSIAGLSASSAADVLAYRNGGDYSKAIAELYERRGDLTEAKFVDALAALERKQREKVLQRTSTVLPDRVGSYSK